MGTVRSAKSCAGSCATDSTLAGRLRQLYRKTLQRPLRTAIYGGFVAIQTLLRAIGFRAARRLSRGIGHVAATVLPYERRVAARNLQRAFPEWSESERRRVRRQAFSHLAESAAELLFIERLADQVNLTGAEALRDTAAERGALLVGGHIGNWELFGVALARAGVPLSVIARRVFDPRFDRWMRAYRDCFGIETIVRDESDAARRMLGALRSGRVLVMLIDQNTGVPSIDMPFFGHPAPTPSGAARLAARGTPTWSGWIRRTAPGRHIAEVRPVALDDPADQAATTALLNHEIESAIRAAPEQWVWFHRRWADN
ncbi:MAG: lipid A biosynthesis acyltransferase [Candidatus Dadabacteria bacterium]|nr:MAG: lipid A biosynthesis acyltransferase [Candidatus Dadabacteria bacterium]